jgi:hypothetical protein
LLVAWLSENSKETPTSHAASNHNFYYTSLTKSVDEIHENTASTRGHSDFQISLSLLKYKQVFEYENLVMVLQGLEEEMKVDSTLELEDV